MTHTSAWNKSLVVVVICELEQLQPHKLVRAVTSLWTISYFPMKFSENVKFNVASNLRRLCKFSGGSMTCGSVCILCSEVSSCRGGPWRQNHTHDRTSEDRTELIFHLSLYTCSMSTSSPENWRAERPELGASLQAFLKSMWRVHVSLSGAEREGCSCL